MWNQEKAIAAARYFEGKLNGIAHVGLTGGCLYKDGDRKDLDIVIYPHANERNYSFNEILGLLELTSEYECLYEHKDYGRKLVKTNIAGCNIDIFFMQ